MIIDNLHVLNNGVLEIDLNISSPAVPPRPNAYLDVSSPNMPPNPNTPPSK